MKKKQIVLYLVVMIMLITTSVYATISAELDVAINSKKICPGDEFSITIKLKDLETTNAIKAIEGYVDINEDVLENLTVKSIVTGQDGKVKIDDKNVLEVYDAKNISSNSDTGVIFNDNPVSKSGDYKIVINLAEAISKDTNLVTLNFKVKDDVKVGEYESAVTYKIFKIFSEDAKEKQELAQKNVNLLVEEKENTPNNPTENKVENKTENPTENKVENKTEKPTENKVENKTEKPTDNKVENKSQNETSINGQNSNHDQNNKNDGTISPTNLPKTGYKLVIFPIIILSILGFVFYKKYSKYNNYHE